jgi:hypothetical protein
LYKKKIAEEKHVAATAAREEREQVKAKKAVEHGCQKEAKEAQNNKNALQKSSRTSANHHAHLSQRPSVRNV